MLHKSAVAGLVGLASGVGLALSACSATPTPASLPAPEKVEINPFVVTKVVVPVPELPDLGMAPDFNSGPWINTETPLTLKSLHGKVVLIEFWTFG